MLTAPITSALPPCPRRTPAHRRPRRSLACWVTLFFAGVASSFASAAVSQEYQVKAAFVFNFTKFVEWPPNRFSSAEAPIVLAVLGRNPFGDELETLVRDRLVDGRRLVVRRLASAEAAKATGAIFHVLFVAAGEESLFASLEEFRPRTGALTVGESDRFAALGGMMNFVVAESRVRFEINRAAVAAAGLKLRAQLQKLAVPGRPSPGSAPP